MWMEITFLVGAIVVFTAIEWWMHKRGFTSRPYQDFSPHVYKNKKQ